MSLNIKNEQVHAMTRELAALTGETLTEAIGVAVRERLERVRNSEDEIERRIARMRAIAEEIGPLVAHVPPLEDLLYDDMGMPK